MSSKDDSIRLKMAKAKGLLAEADTLMQHKFYITVINRLYYSCFHAVKALLLTKDLVPKTHSGVITMLHKHFVQDNSFDAAHASFFSQLMQERIEDDYSDFMIIEESEVTEFLAPAKAFINYIEELLKNYLTKEY